MAPKRQGPGAADAGSAKQRKKPKLEASGPSIPQWNSLELLAASRVSYLAEDDQTLQSVAERSAKACSGYTFILSKVVDEHGPWDTKVVKKKGHADLVWSQEVAAAHRVKVGDIYLKWSKNKIGAKATLLNKFNAIFFYLYPDGKIPSGKQKEDMIFAMKANLHRIYKPKEYAALTATQSDSQAEAGAPAAHQNEQPDVSTTSSSPSLRRSPRLERSGSRRRGRT